MKKFEDYINKLYEYPVQGGTTNIYINGTTDIFLY